MTVLDGSELPSGAEPPGFTSCSTELVTDFATDFVTELVTG
ncbi:hypothetical protein [Streptomyces sp. NPDC093544]